MPFPAQNPLRSRERMCVRVVPLLLNEGPRARVEGFGVSQGRVRVPNAFFIRRIPRPLDSMLGCVCLVRAFFAQGLRRKHLNHTGSTMNAGALGVQAGLGFPEAAALEDRAIATYALDRCIRAYMHACMHACIEDMHT